MSDDGYSSSSSDDDYSDAGSNVSDVSYTGTLLDVDDRLATRTDASLQKEQLLDSLDKISDKRKSTRERGLKVCIQILSKTAEGSEMLEGREETVIFKLLNVIKKNKKNTDAILACRAIELVSITLGANNESMYDECTKVLFPIIKTSKKDAVRGAAIRTASMVCFVSSIEESSTLDCMRLFESVFRDVVESMHDDDDDDYYSHGGRKKKKKKSKNFDALTSSLNGWGLLATTRSEKDLGTSVFKRVAKLFSELLEHDSNEVRKAAGQNAALLAQFYFETHQEDENEEDDEELIGMQSSIERKNVERYYLLTHTDTYHNNFFFFFQLLSKYLMLENRYYTF